MSIKYSTTYEGYQENLSEYNTECKYTGLDNYILFSYSGFDHAQSLDLPALYPTYQTRLGTKLKVTEWPDGTIASTERKYWCGVVIGCSWQPESRCAGMGMVEVMLEIQSPLFNYKTEAKDWARAKVIEIKAGKARKQLEKEQEEAIKALKKAAACSVVLTDTTEILTHTPEVFVDPTVTTTKLSRWGRFCKGMEARRWCKQKPLRETNTTTTLRG